MRREHINTIIQSFKDYIPCTDGNITCFHAPYDCKVNFCSKENLVKEYTNFSTFFLRKVTHHIILFKLMVLYLKILLNQEMTRLRKTT